MSDPTQHSGSRPGQRVVGGGFEEELRRGQVAEGEAGSVEAELAVVHLMRHAAGAETLSPEQLDSVWRDIQKQTSPVPWYRRPLAWLALPAVAAGAAAVVLAVAPPDEAPELEAGGAVALSETVEQQFALLEGPARAAIDTTVERNRADLRRALLARAAGTPNDPDDGSQGGAP